MSAATRDLGIVIERRLPGSPEVVFRALTTPSLYSRWMGPEGSRTTVHEMDVRPGGRLAFRVAIPDGPEVELEGTYTEVDPPRRLVHTWTMAGDPALTTVTFDLRAELGATRLILTHAGFTDVADRDQNDAGWHHQLDRLEAVLTASDDPTA